MNRAYEYKRPKTLNEAAEILSQNDNAVMIAGGTCLMVDIRGKKLDGHMLVDIKNLCADDAARIGGIALLPDGQVSIGALSSIASIASSDIILDNAKALYLASNVFADKTTRNTATIGGNVAYASPAGDTLPALIVHDARIFVTGASGEREISVHDFFTGFRKTALKHDEIITRFVLKPKKSGFIKLGLRNSMAISVATAAASVDTDDNGIITDCRIALGSLAPVPVRAENAESAILGKPWNEDTWRSMYEALQNDISPIDDIRATAKYRRRVAPVIVKRAINLALYSECKEND